MDGEIVDLNVGGTRFTTSKKFLVKYENSIFCEWFTNSNSANLPKDKNGYVFIDRDGDLFRYVLDFLRCDRLMLPDKFNERRRLLNEAQFYKLDRLVECINRPTAGTVTPLVGTAGSTLQRTDSTLRGGYITVGYQGSFVFGPQGLASDVNFRKIMRILVCGRVSLCREVFGDTLNEGRDPDRGHSNDRYTARYYLKHNVLEQAFDALGDAGFKLISSCASGTSGPVDTKKGSNAEEDRWARYSEFVFYRPMDR